MMRVPPLGWKPTSPNTRPPLGAAGTSAGWWTTGPRSTWRARSLSARPPATPFLSSKPPSPKSRPSSAPPGSKTSPTPPPARSPRCASSPTTDPGHVDPLRGLGRLQASHRAHPHPPPSAVDQRRHRALLRSHQRRAPLPARHRRRPGTRQPGRHLPHDLQHDPTPRSHRHAPTPPAGTVRRSPLDKGASDRPSRYSDSLGVRHVLQRGVSTIVLLLGRALPRVASPRRVMLIHGRATTHVSRRWGSTR